MNLVNFISAVLFIFEGEVRFGIDSISKGLTPIGWIIVLFFPLALVSGIILAFIKFVKKKNLK